MAVDSIFQFTTFPLEFGFILGLIISSLGFVYGAVVIYWRLFTERTVPGYTDIMCSVLFLGGIILIYNGILGKYIAVILHQLQDRPEYVVKSSSENKETGPES